MTAPSALAPLPDPFPPPPLEDLVACFDEARVERALAASGACAFALPLGWQARHPQRVAVVPVADLLGWTAPPEVDALVFLGGGRAFHLGDDPPAEGPEVRVVVVLDRAGRRAGRLRVGAAVEHRPPGGGRLLDALQRCLGLPTDPPAGSTGRLLATLWLGALATPGSPTGPHPEGRLLGWPRVLRRHPVAGALAADDPGLGEGALEQAAVAGPEAWTWEALREATASSGVLDVACPAELAGWMDGGMFSRWVGASILPPEPLVAGAAARVTRPAWARLVALLERSGVALEGW